jgi:hypothetical protein
VMKSIRILSFLYVELKGLNCMSGTVIKNLLLISKV